MSFLKTSLRNFEQEHGRNVESRRFINFLLRGGMMSGTPTKQTGPRHVIIDAPIRVLSIGNSLTNNTALAFQKIFQPLFNIPPLDYDVTKASEFFGTTHLRPYTHIIITGHCHSNNGRLEDDAGNPISIVGMLEKINEMQKGLPYKIMFYNCKAFERIYASNEIDMNRVLLNTNVSEAYFANQNVLRFGTNMIDNIQLIQNKQQQFVQWLKNKPRFLMKPANMFVLAALFFGKDIPTDIQISKLEQLLDLASNTSIADLGQSLASNMSTSTAKRKGTPVTEDTKTNDGVISKKMKPSPEAQDSVSRKLF